MLTLTVGRWLVMNHKHDDYASTDLTLVNVTITTRLYGGEEEKEILDFVCVDFSISRYYSCVRPLMNKLNFFCKTKFSYLCTPIDIV